MSRSGRLLSRSWSCICCLRFMVQDSAVNNSHNNVCIFSGMEKLWQIRCIARSVEPHWQWVHKFILIRRTFPNPCNTWTSLSCIILVSSLQIKTLFRGWPVMAHETHTRKRRLQSLNPCCWSLQNGTYSLRLNTETSSIFYILHLFYILQLLTSFIFNCQIITRGVMIDFFYVIDNRFVIIGL